jgi:predicted acylesterase/phospholipase RssA
LPKILNNKGINNTITMVKKDPQRALVLQGGGALGAYEAGVFRVLYNWIKKDIPDDNKNVFDIVAGTSIGAINAAFLVSYVTKRMREEKKTNRESWEGSAEGLEEFWKSGLASNVNLNKWWPFSWDEKSWISGWETLNHTNSSISKWEAARRYYSAKEFIISGAPNVFSPHLTPTIDSKFFDNFIVPNIWYRYDNSRLRRSLNKAIRFPIGTSFNEPRLLVISVDVEKGETVTFDSYEKDSGASTRRSEYGGYKPGTDIKDDTYKRIIKYDKGIMVEHILASASVPEHYDYTLVPKEYDYTKTEQEKLVDLENYNLKNYSRFWDGGLLSNTPLRELITSHQDYWKPKSVEPTTEIDNEDIIPDLEVYIIDVWPSVDGYPVPSDLDGVRNRKNDLTYQDVTPYDVKVATIVSDYYNLTKELLNLARTNKIPEQEITKILNIEGKSLHRNGDPREYGSLLKDRFDITKVIRIERSADENDIANKWCDFSLGTVSNLFDQGINDAQRTLQNK